MHLVELSMLSYITLIIVDSPSHIAGYIPMTVFDPPVLMLKLLNSQPGRSCDDAYLSTSGETGGHLECLNGSLNGILSGIFNGI